jgi:hypothetical protein
MDVLEAELVQTRKVLSVWMRSEHELFWLDLKAAVKVPRLLLGALK